MVQVAACLPSKHEPWVQGAVWTKKPQKSIKSGKNVIFYLVIDGTNTYTY
jgi:hypothetical protein